ncbi:Putative lysophospholipase [Seminavis robusta]|uniref:Lysophospholipase n=1 Tax=Seminavis robusta TaxID=568900 RepID=A0A9N8HPV7_9STRA|nr:Putative lysophospholipase [Seminavis robusta]|eukprot:Sro1132_g244770.1 Putative lysophospholipase (595) ;mRNA; r:19354-21644
MEELQEAPLAFMGASKDEDLIAATSRLVYKTDDNQLMNIEVFGGVRASSKTLLIFIPGICESAETLAVQSIVAAATEITVAVLELPGHGLSSGTRGVVREFEHLLASVIGAIEFTIEQLNPDHTFLTGSSLGGVLAIYVASRVDDFVGIAPIAPAMGVAPQAVPHWTLVSGLQALACIGPTWQIPSVTPYEDASHYNCPSSTQRNFTGYWPLATCKMLLDLTSQRVPNDIATPGRLALKMTPNVLVIAGKRDYVVPLSCIQDFYQQQLQFLGGKISEQQGKSLRNGIHEKELCSRIQEGSSQGVLPRSGRSEKAKMAKTTREAFALRHGVKNTVFGRWISECKQGKFDVVDRSRRRLPGTTKSGRSEVPAGVEMQQFKTGKTLGKVVAVAGLPATTPRAGELSLDDKNCYNLETPLGDPTLEGQESGSECAQGDTVTVEGWPEIVSPLTVIRTDTSPTENLTSNLVDENLLQQPIMDIVDHDIREFVVGGWPKMTERLSISPCHTDDAEEINKYLHGDKDVMEKVCAGKTRTFQETHWRIKRFQRQWEEGCHFTVFTVRELKSNCLVGIAVLEPCGKDNSAEVSGLVRKESWDK